MDSEVAMPLPGNHHNILKNAFVGETIGKMLFAYKLS